MSRSYSLFDEPERKKSREELWLDELKKLETFEFGNDTQVTDGKESWEACRSMTKRYDSQLYENWKDEVEKLLIFSGLFSAVVTTFVAQSYQLLQSDTQIPDTAIILLTNIALQLNRITDPSSEVEIPAISNAQQPFSPSNANVWINALWFISLVLSLSSALIGIVCVQWIRQYIQDHELCAQQWLKQRQSLCEGLEAWHVRLFIVSLPVILQLAVALFFVGMVILLWGLSVSVAVPVTIVTAIPLIFITVTPFIPVVQTLSARFPFTLRHLKMCPYKTHQGLLLSKVVLLLALGYIRTRMALLKLGLSKRYLNLDIYSSIKSHFNVYIRLFGFPKNTTEGNGTEAAPENSAEKRIEQTIERRETILNDYNEKYKSAKKIFSSWHWEVLDGEWRLHRADPNADKLYPMDNLEDHVKRFVETAALNHDVVNSLVWLTKTFCRDPEKAFTVLTTLRSSNHHYDSTPVFVRVIEDIYAESLDHACVQAVKNPIKRTGDKEKDMKAIKAAAEHWKNFKMLRKIKGLRLSSQNIYHRREAASALFLEYMTVEEWTNKRPVVSARVECFIRSTHSYKNDPEYPPPVFGADLLGYFFVGHGDMIRNFQTGVASTRWDKMDGIEGILLSLLYRFTNYGGLYKAENDRPSVKLYDSDFLNAGRILSAVCLEIHEYLESGSKTLKKATKPYKIKAKELIRNIEGILEEYRIKNKIIEAGTQAATSGSEPPAALLQIEAPLTSNPEPTTPISKPLSQPPLCDVSTLHNFILFLHGFTGDRMILQDELVKEAQFIRNLFRKIAEVINEVVLRINQEHSDHWYSDAETAACYSAWMDFKVWYNKYSDTKLREELPSTSPAAPPPQPTPPDNSQPQATTITDVEPSPASDSLCTNKEEEDISTDDKPVQSRWTRFLRSTPADCFMRTMP